jgi:bifunctional non-homologous end joining protein LigD
LESWVKTTGGKGLHVVVPIQPKDTWDVVKTFCKTVCEVFASATPKRYTVNPVKAARKGKLFLDYLRNGRGATAVAPYSTRANDAALVAMPLSWEELEGGARPSDFDIGTVSERIQTRHPDPWTGMHASKQTLRAAAEALRRRATRRRAA